MLGVNGENSSIYPAFTSFCKALTIASCRGMKSKCDTRSMSNMMYRCGVKFTCMNAMYVRSYSELITAHRFCITFDLEHA
jgi:hypothetical protein